MIKKRISRRNFLKTTGVATIGVGMALPQVLSGKAANLSDAPDVDKKQLVAALGDTIIPTAQGDPGYKTLEPYGISQEVLKGMAVSQPDWNTFNAAAGEFFSGKTFLDLGEEERTAFLQMIVDSSPSGSLAGAVESGPGVFALAADETAKPAGSGPLAAKLDPSVIQTVRKVFRFARAQVFKVYYQNFPENHVARDKNNFPILPPGDQHQIINPNTKELVTGWDIANFPGPLSWEEEEARRAKWMKIHWHND
jgi:hypothetical protein